MTSVSVVIPSHNRPELIEAAVASVLAQPETTEVIVVDDGSTPPVRPVGALDNAAVTIVRNDLAQGPSHARNRGLDAATGDFVGFLDDDDRWLPDKLAACLAALDAHPEAGVVAHRTGYTAPAGVGSVQPSLLVDPLRYFGTHQTPHPDSLLIRRDVAAKVRFAEDLGAAEDVDFAIELARVTPFVMIDAVYALHGPDDVPTAIGVKKRIEARRELRQRHADVLYNDKASRAFYHVRLGHLLRNVSKPEAARSFATALRYQPGSVLAWRGLTATLFPASVARRISKQRRTGDA